MQHAQTWRRRAYDYMFGTYPGPPVDYLIAIAIVFAMISVVGASIIRTNVPIIAEGVLERLVVLVDLLL